MCGWGICCTFVRPTRLIPHPFGARSQSSSRVTWTIDKINENMITNTQLQLQLHALSQLNNRIFSQQNLMRVYAQHEHELERNTLFTYAEMTVSPSDNAIQGLLAQIHLLIAGTDELRSVGSSGLLELIAENLKVNAVCCVELEPGGGQRACDNGR